MAIHKQVLKKDEIQGARGKVQNLAKVNFSSRAEELSPEKLKEVAGKIADKFKINPIVARVLAVRGEKGDKKTKAFLDANLKKEMGDPLTIKGMTGALDVIEEIIRNNEKVVICHDYDVDGVTSATQFKRLFRQMGLARNIKSTASRRFTEGYSINCKKVERLCRQGNKNLLFLDFGSKNQKEIELANKLGARVVVIDHHHIEESDPLPEAAAFINPEQEGCGYHEKKLCTAGLAWIFAGALRDRLKESGDPDLIKKAGKIRLKGLLAYSALGTVADVVPLKGLNRAIVKAGVPVFAESSDKGIRAIKFVCNKMGLNVDSESFAFKVGPRVNAAGRMENTGADKAVTLFTTTNLKVATKYAEHLDDMNRDRKATELEGVRIVEEELNKQKEVPWCVVVADKRFHTGVAGIVASRIKDKFNRPAFVLAPAKTGEGLDVYTGSGRCSEHPALHLAEILGSEAVAPFVHKGGGHSAAAGVSIPVKLIGDFREAFNSEVEKALEGKEPDINIKADLEVTVKEINEQGHEMLRDLELLEPFGKDNPAVKFEIKNLNVVISEVFGHRHLRVSFRQDTGEKLQDPQDCFIDGVFWHQKDNDLIKDGARVDVIGQIMVSKRRADHNPDNQKFIINIERIKASE